LQVIESVGFLHLAVMQEISILCEKNVLFKTETESCRFVTGGMFPDVAGIISDKMLTGFKTGPILADPTKGSPALARKDFVFLSHV